MSAHQQLADYQGEMSELCHQIGLCEAELNSLGVTCERVANKLESANLQIDILTALIKSGDLEVAALVVADWEANQ